MPEKTQSMTAKRIRELARKHGVQYVEMPNDALARHITRLAGDDVQLDDVEHLLIALQRGGHLSRSELVILQANYLREAKP